MLTTQSLGSRVGGPSCDLSGVFSETVRASDSPFATHTLSTPLSQSLQNKGENRQDLGFWWSAEVSGAGVFRSGYW